MGNKIAAPILEKEEAISRWNKTDFQHMKQTFETYSRIQDKERMSKSAFMNYAFPFIPKELIERLFVTFQLQVVDDTLKFNYKRNIKMGAKYRTNSPIKSPINDHKNNDTDHDKSNDKKKKTKKKKKSTPKVGKPPFLSFTITFEQFLIGMTLIIHGTIKEKLLLFWRMFDIEYKDNTKLSYFDMEQILNILFNLDTNFFNKTVDQLLYDLFTFELPSNDVAHYDIKDTSNSPPTPQIIDKKSNDFDVDIEELIEHKMQDIATKKNETHSNKTDEKVQLLNEHKSNDIKLDDNNKSMDELEELQEKTITFEHFYEWSKQYDTDTNPFISWLCTFPPPPIQPLPQTFVKIWQDLYLNCDTTLHEKYGYLCTDNSYIYATVQQSKFSVSEVIKMYSAWYNTQEIYECNCGYFLTFEQFSNIFEMYITDPVHMDIVFKVIDEDNDGNVTVNDIINTLSIIMKRRMDMTVDDRINEIIGDMDVDIVFDGLHRYALIEFGINPLPQRISLEFEIISSLFQDLNSILNEYTQPAFEEYGDHYYLISSIWWNKWCDKLNIKASYKYDGRVANISCNEEEHKSSQALGPIDNTSLILKYANDEFILKPDLNGCISVDADGDYNYICVAPAIWKVLLKWYGGGPGIRRSIIGNYDIENKQNISYLEIYPMRLYIHTKTSPELLDKQREILENLKLERDYKAAEAKQSPSIPALQRRASSIFNVHTPTLLTHKMDHIYNGNYYQWEIFISPQTSLQYIKQIILKYDPLIISMQQNETNTCEIEQQLRFWWLHNERSLVIQPHNRMKIKILNTSPSYEQFVKMKKNANGKLSKLFGGKKKNKKPKKKKKKKKKKYISPVPKSKPPVLFEGNELIGDTELTTNNYIYLEVQQTNGQWEGVKISKTNNESSDDEDEKITETLTKENGDGEKEEKEENNSEYEALENPEKNINFDENILSHGVIGLQNLGNTCFLNAAVQCLSHSLPFQQYLLSNVFINEINKDNFLGNNGRVPIAFAALIRALYASKPYSIHSPRNLRALIQELNPMFEGNLQHDSQEALQFLLQGIHQDLNRIKVKPKGLQCGDSNGRRDEIVANEAWDIFTKTDQSVIVDLFMGQYRSTTTCLRCNRQNHKFDTYQMLSLPIPIVDSKFIHILVHFRSPFRKSIKYSFKLPDSTTIQDIIHKVSKIVLIPSHLLIPAHIVNHTIYQIITLNKQITNINLTDIIMLYEAPKWSFLSRPERNIFEVPIGFKIGTHFDIKDKINNKWYHGQVVELCHMSQWNEKEMRNRIYILYDEKYAKKDENKNENENETDLRGLWKMKIHFVGWKDVWDEWIDCSDDLRINKAGTHCKDVPSEIKYPRIYPAIPYHVITIKCLHRRIVATKASFWEGRGYQLRIFGTPLLLFLPRNGFNTFELYHYIWNFIQLRYLNQHNTYFTSNTNNNNTKQNKEYDMFNAITNAYIHIFGGNIFNNYIASNKNLNDISPPFVLRRVDKFGVKCSQTHWDKYCIGSVIELEVDHNKILELNDEEYIAIDWNEEFFETFFTDIEEKNEEKEIVKKVAENKSTSFLNNQSLLFDELLDDETVIKHFAQFSKSISIGDCIREFQKEEKLSEYFCEKCQKKIDATKSLRIWSTPPILIFHFKRTGNFGRKIDTNVDYLLNNFDVSPFLVSRTIDDSIETIKDNKEEDEEEKKTNINKEWPRFPVPSSKQTHYNLFGAINHYGAAGAGHYIANCLCKDVNISGDNDSKSNGNDNDNINQDENGINSALKWYLFDDHRVTTVSPLDVKSKNAYLLFYIRSDIQELFVQHLLNKSSNDNDNNDNGNDKEKLFDIHHIDPEKHFQFLPDNIRELIGETLTTQQIKLLNSEGVETRTINNCIIL